MQPMRGGPPTDVLTELAGFAAVVMLIAGLSLGAVQSLRASFPPDAAAEPSPFAFEPYIFRYPGDRDRLLQPTDDAHAIQPAPPPRRLSPLLDSRAQPYPPVG